MENHFYSPTCLQTKLVNSLKVIRKYDWLINSYVADFYVDNHWSKLPQAWRECFEDLTPEQLCFLLDSKSVDPLKVHRIWPLSLLALKQIFLELCVKRQKTCKNNPHRNAMLDHPKLKHIFTKGVKPKKRHELNCMATLCEYSCQETPVDFVIDFGAGLGHLARVLGYAYNIKMCCLEMQKKLNVQASEMDQHMEKLIKYYLPNPEGENYQKPVHENLCLTAEMTTEQFLNSIEKVLNISNKDYKFGIIGLHPCGDLGAILIRMFLKCKQARFLNFVGCCYHKLTTSERGFISEKLYGYPLSDFLKSNPSFSRLSYEAREISCHAMELYNERLSLMDYEYLKIHSFRAAAERIIVKHYPSLKHSGLKSVKHSPEMQFKDYFYKAVKGLPVETLPSNLLEIAHLDLLQWKNVVIFYTLRLFFAPLIESVLLYDRILYLLENDCKVQINPIFDPRLSPRNHITSAVKRS